VVPPTSGGYDADDGGGPDGPQAFDGYGPGLSGSAWAERGGTGDYGPPRSQPGDLRGGDLAYAADTYGADSYGVGEAAPAAEQRPSRRHAAPDTGTDLARYGLGPAATPPAQSYGAASPSYGAAAAPEAFGAASAAQSYGTAGRPRSYGTAAAAAYDGEPAPRTYDGEPAPRTYDGEPAPRTYGGEPAPRTYGGGYGYDRTGGYNYADPAPHEQPAPSAYGIETSSFFDTDDTATDAADAGNDGPAPGRGYPQPAKHGRAASPGYGPDPLAPQHGWAPRSQEHPGRR
jgi:hypothetical protein